MNKPLVHSNYKDHGQRESHNQPGHDISPIRIHIVTKLNHFMIDGFQYGDQLKRYKLKTNEGRFGNANNVAFMPANI